MKFPVPSPRKMETVLLSALATAKSSLPSPLKSPTATERGSTPVAGDEARLKFPVPSPNRIETVLLNVIGNRKVQLAIPVEVAHGYRDGPATRGGRRR